MLVFLGLATVTAQSTDKPSENPSIPDTSGLVIISSHPEKYISPLPPKTKENSGIIFFRDKIWTHNDSGGDPDIYAIDTATGEIIQTITLEGAKNIDWEDIDQDDQHIFIGDFGNNRGNRTDLSIYKVAKKDIPKFGDATIEAYERISFGYADQEITTKKMNRHNYDCEAMISLNENIYLFTKNWGDQKTRVYALPKVSGDYQPEPMAEFEADGLITAAGLSPDGNQLALLGYIDYESFMWLFWDFEGVDFFGGNSLRVNFPDMVFVQTEGICFITENDIIISCEESAEFPSLFSIQSNALKAAAGSRLGNYFSDDIVLSGMPPEVSRRLRVDVLKVPQPYFTFELRDRRWEKHDEGSAIMKANDKKVRLSIKTKDLDDGLYFLRIKSGEHSLIRKVRVKH